MKPYRIGIVHPKPNFDTIPSLCNAALLLARHGYRVDIFTHFSRRYRKPALAEPGVRFRISLLDTLLELALPENRRLEIRRRSSSGESDEGITDADLSRRYRFLRAIYRQARRWLDRLSVAASAVRVWWLHQRAPYRCFIGVDAEGLLLAHTFSRLTGAPVAYHSLELLLSDELHTPQERQIKQRELPLSRQAAFVIIQDDQRAALMARDNAIPEGKFVFLPNAPLGPARHEPSGYWHRRFDLPSETRVVLHAGSLDTWTGIEDIVASVQAWPEPWVLVVHTRYNAQDSEIIGRLRELAAPGRVFFSLEPVPQDEYDHLVAGADAGLAFYVTVPGVWYAGSNISTIGLSSGKLSYYLRAGLPVIVNEAASISALVRQEGCGVPVADAAGVGQALAQIASHYEQYSGQARRVFDQHLDFARNFEQVTARIDSLPEKK